MSQSVSRLIRRLAKVERGVNQMAKRERLAGCICKQEGTANDLTVASSPEQFEAEMNRSCPVHGFRRLGQVMVIVFVNPDQTYTEDSIKLGQMVKAYNLRLSQQLQSEIDFDDESQVA